MRSVNGEHGSELLGAQQRPDEVHEDEDGGQGGRRARARSSPHQVAEPMSPKRPTKATARMARITDVRSCRSDRALVSSGGEQALDGLEQGLEGERLGQVARDAVVRARRSGLDRRSPITTTTGGEPGRGERRAPQEAQPVSSGRLMSSRTTHGRSPSRRAARASSAVGRTSVGMARDRAGVARRSRRSVSSSSTRSTSGRRAGSGIVRAPPGCRGRPRRPARVVSDGRRLHRLGREHASIKASPKRRPPTTHRAARPAGDADDRALEQAAARGRSAARAASAGRAVSMPRPYRPLQEAAPRSASRPLKDRSRSSRIAARRRVRCGDPVAHARLRDDQDPQVARRVGGRDLAADLAHVDVDVVGSSL